MKDYTLDQAGVLFSVGPGLPSHKPGAPFAAMPSPRAKYPVRPDIEGAVSEPSAQPTGGSIVERREIDALSLQNSELKHDLNNLLQISLSALSMIAIRIEQGRSSEISALVQRAELSLERGSMVAQRMAALPFVAEREVRPLDVNLAIAEMHGIFSSTVGPDVEIRMRLDPFRSFVRCDRISLETAVLNLMTNARNAIAGPGLIEIRTSIQLRRHPTSPDPCEHVAIEVSDSGHGMTQDVASRAFEAFYSTRHGSGGSGLGLAAVKRFLDENNGHSAIRSDVGKGTSVSLFLPISMRAME